jgi:hypothetical protein
VSSESEGAGVMGYSQPQFLSLRWGLAPIIFREQEEHSRSSAAKIQKYFFIVNDFGRQKYKKR